MDLMVNPYLSFRDNAREAMEFYHGIFGGELAVSTFADMGASESPDDAELVMHSHLTTERGFVLMASDTPARMPFESGARIAISIGGYASDGEVLRGYWNGLAEGGTVTMPLEPASWGDTFGMVTDRYGIEWMISISHTDAAAAA